MTRTTRRPARLAFMMATALVTLGMPALAGNAHAAGASGKTGLGAVLNTADGQQIYGYDIDQNGNDGVLASAGYQGNTFVVSVETFDETTGKITKSFATKNSARNSYGVDGIFTGDVGLITHYIIPKGSIYAKRVYDLMNPVTAGRFTGSWTPPINDIDVQQAAENQATTTAVLFAIELKNNDRPDLVVSDVGANTFSNVYHLDPNLFCLCDGPQLGQYAAGNEAVFALSPDGGAVGGNAPVNVLVDLASGKTTQFNGYNNGFYHAGYVNGLAVDPNTGVGATTTELNAQVEFYNMATKSGIVAVQLPCTGDTDQGASGSGIAVDPVNKLFLVTESFDACAGHGSALLVYDESGNLVEDIEGFNFVGAEPAPALNPSTRMGWALSGPQGVSQLQQFFY